MDIRITSSDAGKTIRSLLRTDLGFSSSMLKKLKFSEGGILVNGEFQTVRYELREGDILSVAVEDTERDVSPYIVPVELPITIAFRDEYLTVVNKPPFMPSHPSFGHRYDTVANALAYLNRDKPYVFRPVSRLDGNTSGAMLVANSRLASYTLNKSMEEGGIHKTYVAVLDGILPEKRGTVVTYIRRVAGSVIEREVCGENEGGKLAVTGYEVIRESGGKSLVRASPVTGRTHQLRVHFAHLGAPITGDSLYGNASSEIPRQALHSRKVSFVHPANGERTEISAELPDDLATLIHKYFGGLTTDGEEI